MSTLTQLLTRTIPSTLIIGAVLVLVGIVFIIKPELSLAPLGGDGGWVDNAASLWGRLVGVVLLLLGGLLSMIGLWNLVYT